MKLTDFDRILRQEAMKETKPPTRAKRILAREMGFKEFENLPVIDHVEISTTEGIERLDEGQWFSGRFPNNIRQDRPTHLHGNGQTHAHVQARNGEDYVIVNLDGSSSHGMPGKLHQKDADALRLRGYPIPSTNIVEWLLDTPENRQTLLLG